MRKWEQGPPVEVFRHYCLLHQTISTEFDRGVAISLQEASRRMKTSAGSLSSMLKELESYYGLESGTLLLRKDSGGCQLTDHSWNLYQRALRCVEAHDALRGWTHAVQSGVLRIGSPLIVNANIIPEVLKRCAPKWDASVDVDYRDEEPFLGRISHLRQEKYSLVIDVVDQHGFEGIRCDTLKGFKSVPWLLLPPDSKDGKDPFRELRSEKVGGQFRERQFIPVAELGRYPLAFSDNPAVVTRLPQADRSTGFRIASNSTISVLHLVSHRVCVGIVYAWRSLVDRWLSQTTGLQAIPLASAGNSASSLPEYEFGLYTLEKRCLRDFELSFARHLRTFAREGCPQPLVDRPDRPV